MEIIDYDGYLTEEKLGSVLRQVYPKSDDYVVTPQWKLDRFRIDYVVSKAGADLYAFEFDGPTHFTSWDSQTRDVRKEVGLVNRGISVIRIPYFVQLTDETIPRYLPQVNASSAVVFPHGFIDKKVTYPSDFNTRRFSIFKDILAGLPEQVRSQVITSSLSNGFLVRDWPT